MCAYVKPEYQTTNVMIFLLLLRRMQYREQNAMCHVFFSATSVPFSDFSVTHIIVWANQHRDTSFKLVRAVNQTLDCSSSLSLPECAIKLVTEVHKCDGLCLTETVKILNSPPALPGLPQLITPPSVPPQLMAVVVVTGAENALLRSARAAYLSPHEAGGW